MIARIWHGRVRRADRERYHQFLLRTGLADYGATPGNLGVHLLLRDEGDVTEVITLTFWDSLDAVRSFAGEDVLRARYYPDDDQYLLEKEEFVTHWDVAAPG